MLVLRRHRRILAVAVGILLLAVFALPALAPQHSSDEQALQATTSATVAQTPLSQSASTEQRSGEQPSSAQRSGNGQTLQPSTAQPTEIPAPEHVSNLRIGAGDVNCSLKEAGNQGTPEAAGEASRPVKDALTTLVLGDDCQKVTARLRVPAGGTLWLNLVYADQPDPYTKLSTVAGDAAPPQLDERGRYFGCTQTQVDAGVCQVMVEVEGTSYRVAVPLKAATT